MSWRVPLSFDFTARASNGPPETEPFVHSRRRWPKRRRFRAEGARGCNKRELAEVPPPPRATPAVLPLSYHSALFHVEQKKERERKAGFIN